MPVRRATTCSARRSNRRSPRASRRCLRPGLFLGRRAAVLAARRRLHDRGRLRRRLHAEPDIRGGLQRLDRPHRGRAGRVRPHGSLARRAPAHVLGGPRPDAGHAPGQRHRHPVPLGGLLRARTRSAPLEASREGYQASLTEAGSARSRPRSPPPARSTTPRRTTSSTWTRTRTATAASAARRHLPDRARRQGELGCGNRRLPLPGGVAEWSNAAVLKTAGPVPPAPWVRIPPPPLSGSRRVPFAPTSSPARTAAATPSAAPASPAASKRSAAGVRRPVPHAGVSRLRAATERPQLVAGERVKRGGDQAGGVARRAGIDGVDRAPRDAAAAPPSRRSARRACGWSGVRVRSKERRSASTRVDQRPRHRPADVQAPRDGAGVAQPVPDPEAEPPLPPRGRARRRPAACRGRASRRRSTWAATLTSSHCAISPSKAPCPPSATASVDRTGDLQLHEAARPAAERQGAP